MKRGAITAACSDGRLHGAAIGAIA